MPNQAMSAESSPGLLARLVTLTRTRWSAVALVVVLATPIVVAATNWEGFRATRMNLNDAGVWVVNWQRGLVGRLNTQLGQIEVVVGVASRDFDVSQVDESVAVTTPAPSRMAAIDVGLAVLGRETELPAGSAVELRGPTGAITQPATGRIWVTTRSALPTLDPEKAAPSLELGDEARGAVTVSAVGEDGTLYAYREGADSISVLPPGGTATTRRVDPQVGEVQLTVVGTTPVVLSSRDGTLAVPDGPKVDVKKLHPGSQDGGFALQQPGPASGEVLVGVDDAVLAVSLHNRDVRVLIDGGTRGPVAPVRLGSCVFGAWRGTPRYAQLCEGRPLLTDSVEGVRAGAVMAFRVNRQRVVLNDNANGVNLLFTDHDPIVVDNWDEALDRDKDDQEQDQQLETKQVSLDCQGSAGAAVLRDDAVGTRPGRPVIVRVLDNDEIPSCEVPRVEIVEGTATADVAAVVENGTSVQVTPPPEAGSPITLRYRLAATEGGPSPQAQIRVEVVPLSQNRAPTANPDRTTVVAGRVVQHNVLANDIDPDGDALTLTEVRGGTGTLQWRADGLLSFTAPGGFTGTQTLEYTVEDELGEKASSTLQIDVLPEEVNVEPIARPDRIDAVVGRPTTFNLLANDSDPNGDRLLLAQVEQPSGLELRWEEDGDLMVTPSSAGTWQFTYTVTDGEKTSPARVRVDAVLPEGNHPPVAVRDEIVVRAGVPAVTDLVGNDIDRDGDALAVSALELQSDSKLSVELLELHIVRVIAQAGFERSEVVRYTVSDGSSVAVGVLVVRPYRQIGVNQPPVTVTDEVTIRAGQVTAVPVLANDFDPEGERLSVSRVDELPEGSGLVFVQRDELRYQAPPVGPASVTFAYTAMDPAGNMADGLVRVQVLPADQANQPPRPPELVARVFAGDEMDIRVPLAGLDPDGDVVSVVAVTEPPAQGHAMVRSYGFRYRADHGSSGPDSFTFRVRDSRGAEATGRVRLVIIERPGRNSNPVAVPDRAKVRAGSKVPISVLANDTDPDGDPLVLAVDGKDAPSTPRTGRVEADVAAGVLVYHAPSGERGEVGFSYTVTDGRGGAARGVVVVLLEADPANDPPIARDDFVDPQPRGAQVDVDVLANDSDPDGGVESLSVRIVSGGDQAEVLPNRQVRIRTGETSTVVVYEVTDGRGASARAAIFVPVLEHRAPVCELQTVKLRAGESVTVPVLDHCTAFDGTRLTLTEVFAARGGSVRLDDSKTMAVFTAEQDVRRDAGFAFRLFDGTTDAVFGVVVEVEGRNFPPRLVATTVEVPAGGSRSVDLDALVEDPNRGDRHGFSDLQGQTAKIRASIDASKLTVTVTDDARGETAELTLSVTDGTESVRGTIAVRVGRHDQPPPLAVDDMFETLQEKPVTVDLTSNDIDPLGRGLRVEVLAAKGGAAQVEGGGRVQFSPGAGFFGTAELTYQVLDATNDPDRASRATARINVVGRPSAPAPPSRDGQQESRQIRLRWGAPSPNGAPITKYSVESDTGIMQECPNTTCLVGGLENGRPYRFRVAAWNRAVTAYEELQWSEWSAALRPVPSAPPPPTLTFNDQRIDVAWLPPVDNDLPADRYELQIGGTATSRTEWADGSARTLSVSGLQNGTLYTIRVRAWYGPAFTEWSVAQSERPTGPPGAVGNLRAQETSGAGQVAMVALSWTAANPNGDPAGVSSYVVSVSPQPPGFSTGTLTLPGTTTSAEFPLDFGTSYTFRLHGVNRYTDTYGVVPSQISETVFRPDNNPRISLQSVSATTSSIRQDFAVTWRGGQGTCALTGDGPAGWSASCDAGSTVAVASNLYASSSYSFQLCVTNAQGVSRCESFRASTDRVTRTVQDDILGGVCKRTGTTDPRWIRRTGCPTGLWLENGTSVAVTCAKSDTSYYVSNYGKDEWWAWWARLTDGYWIPVAVIESSDHAPSGVRTC